MSRAAPALSLSREHRSVLEALAASEAPGRGPRIAAALLMAADGEPNTRIAAKLGAAPKTIRSWRKQFAEHGLNALGNVGPRRGRQPQIPRERLDAIVRATLHEPPPSGSRWSCRSMATAFGVSSSTVQRIWAAHNISPPTHKRTGSSAVGRKPG